MENLILGPTIVITGEYQIPTEVNNLMAHNWLPLTILKKGQYFDMVKERFEAENYGYDGKIIGLLTSVGFYKLDTA